LEVILGESPATKGIVQLNYFGLLCGGRAFTAIPLVLCQSARLVGSSPAVAAQPPQPSTFWQSPAWYFRYNPSRTVWPTSTPISPKRFVRADVIMGELTGMLPLIILKKKAVKS